jgi:hypothetical protein
MAFDDQKAFPPRFGLCLFDDMGTLIAEHEVDEIPVARTFLLSLVALAATWLFLIALDTELHVSGCARAGKGMR